MTRSFDRRAGQPPSHLDPALIVRKCDRIKAEELVKNMTRSYDRRGGYQGGSKPVGELMPPPANISSASIRPEQMACCDYCGHALTLTKVGLFPLHHPWDSTACEGSGKDPRTTSKKEEPVSLDLDCMCSKNDPDCAECWVPNKQFAPNTDWAGKDLGKFRLVDDGKAELRIVSDFDRDVRHRFDECLELLLRKHKDYSGKNIAQSPGGALNGLRVRMHDKQARINNLIDKGTAPEYEPLRDSFLDLANYAVIALMVIDGTWPSE